MKTPGGLCAEPVRLLTVLGDLSANIGNDTLEGLLIRPEMV